MENLQNAVSMQCDIMVAGGSLEGCTAAITAARNGKQVILVEKQGSLGGMASNGLAGWMEPCDNNSQAMSLRSEILQALDCKDNSDGALYPDQRMKIVLGGMLKKAGVVWLDHVFLSNPIMVNSQLKGFAVVGKSGTIQIACDQVIDATDTLETAGMLGLETVFTEKAVSLAVKMNGLHDDAVQTVKNPAGGRIGMIHLPLENDYDGLRVHCDELTVLLRDYTGEALVSGLYCDIQSFTPLTLSAAQMVLSRFAYDLRDHMRSIKDMEHCNIIHVAPRMNAYGLRQCKNKYPSLTLLNNDQEGYSNLRALEKGAAV